MTGFSSHTAVVTAKKDEKVSVVVEIKSLNARFFELNSKMPSSLSSLEIPITNYLKEKLIRGRVFLSIRIGAGSDLFEKVLPSVKIVKDYISSIKVLQKETKIKGDVKISDILSLDSIFSFEREPVGKKFENALLQVVYKTAGKLVLSRKAEGKRLQIDLKKRFDLCNKHIGKINKLFTLFIKEKKEELKNILLLAKSGDLEAENQLSDRYEFLNKIDIHEEIIRFKSHLKSVQKILSSKSIETGKRLEFTLQELSRETNTIAAKCSHVDISSVAVDVKVELEKVREQVQNIV
jgi:uncharacterized protein (TIGR00255 family)